MKFLMRVALIAFIQMCAAVIAYVIRLDQSVLLVVLVVSLVAVIGSDIESRKKI